jgi:hypothetical protein
MRFWWLALAVIALACVIDRVRIPTSHLDVPHIRSGSADVVPTTIDRMVELLVLLDSAAPGARSCQAW